MATAWKLPSRLFPRPLSSPRHFMRCSFLLFFAFLPLPFTPFSPLSSWTFLCQIHNAVQWFENNGHRNVVSFLFLSLSFASSLHLLEFFCCCPFCTLSFIALITLNVYAYLKCEEREREDDVLPQGSDACNKRGKPVTFVCPYTTLPSHIISGREALTWETWLSPAFCHYQYERADLAELYKIG